MPDHGTDRGSETVAIQQLCAPITSIMDSQAHSPPWHIKAERLSAPLARDEEGSPATGPNSMEALHGGDKSLRNSSNSKANLFHALP